MSNSKEGHSHGESHGEGNSTGPLYLHPGEEFPSLIPARPPVGPLSQARPSLVELLSTVSHEFRTPLAVIEGFTSMLLRHGQQISSEEQQESLQAIQQAGRRLSILMDQLLEIGQLEAGAVQLEDGLVDIPALARAAIALAQQHGPAALHDRFTFHLQCRDVTGNQTQEVPAVKGDALRLRHVLDHLLDNATRFSPQGGRIDVIVRPAPQAGSASQEEQPASLAPFLEICVCDVGLGMAEEHLPHIFEPFYRVDTRLTSEVGGLGLGLTLARSYVALHQGRIWAESCPAGGSVFHVWLPLADAS